MNILIFENEKEYFESIFNGVNIAYFRGLLTFKWLASSQELVPFESIISYDAVVVDLDLSRNSQMDGYAILKKAIELGVPVAKLIIFTGSDSVIENLKKKDLPPLEIITKPPTADAIRKCIQNTTR